MPLQTPCPNCGHVGLSRVEHVIKGTEAIKAWYCGACEHEWKEPQSRPTAILLPNRRRPITRTLRGK